MVGVGGVELKESLVDDDMQHSWRRVALGLRPVCSGGHSQSNATIRDVETYRDLRGVWHEGFEQGKSKGDD